MFGSETTPVAIGQPGKCDVVIDGQWGSTGKGKLAGYLHETGFYHVCVTDNMPNAGHTYVDDCGKEFVFHVLPVGSLWGATCLIGPHSVIHYDHFVRELEMIAEPMGSPPEVFIHPLACVVKDADREAEKFLVKEIASTGQGGMNATLWKMRRMPGKATLAQDDPRLGDYVADTHVILQDKLASDKKALIEGSQGFDLGLNHGHKWPHVTSRDVMIGRMLDNAGVSPRRHGATIVSLRTFPIRVGNTEGTSGPGHEDHVERLWPDVSKVAGVEVEEKTTTTKRVRRVFDWSDVQIRRMCRFIEPDYAFLNFVNYFGNSKERQEFIIKAGVLLKSCGCRLRWLGTGAKLSDMEEL